jgi:hypothetical protein
LARFAETLDFVLTQVPGVELQVFPLALLPGTELRARARGLGLSALERPPYTVTRTPGYEVDDLAVAFDRFEQATGLELDPVPFPRLAGSWEGGEGAPYVSGVKIDASSAPPAWAEQVARRATRDLTVWVRGWSETLPAQLGALEAALPHGVLTVVLEDRAGWPPERMDRLLAGGERDSYLARHLRHLYGEGALVTLRLVVLVEDGDLRATDRWVTRIRTRADLAWILEASPGWRERASALTREGETVHVRGPVTVGELPALARTLGADAVGLGFSAAETQANWEHITGADGFRAPEHRISIP